MHAIIRRKLHDAYSATWMMVGLDKPTNKSNIGHNTKCTLLVKNMQQGAGVGGLNPPIAAYFMGGI